MMLPRVGRSRPFMQRSSVLLPEPEAPMMQTTSRRATWHDTPCSTSLSPKLSRKSLISIMFARHLFAPVGVRASVIPGVGMRTPRRRSYRRPAADRA